ncbi:MAG: MFS transporter [Ruminococcaceae bacterium]|nr:MFS transporter [Oscillospiraceae bacterium]
MYKKKSSAVGKEGPKLWTKNFVFIILINFLVFMNHIMILSTFPFYIETMGGTAAVAGLAATLFSLVAVLCRPFIGWMLNNGKRKSILAVGIVGMALMPLGYMAVSVLFLAFVARMVHGASLACSNTTSSTIATDIIPKERFAEGMGMFGMSTAFATALAPALGLFLMDKMGYRTLFLSATGAIVIAFILFLMLRVPEISVGKTPLNFKQLVDKDALPASTIVLVFLLTFGALENFTAKFASENGLPSGGIFFTIMACMLFLTRATIGKAADKRGKESLFIHAMPPCLPLFYFWLSSPIQQLSLLRPLWPDMGSAA